MATSSFVPTFTPSFTLGPQTAPRTPHVHKQEHTVDQHLGGESTHFQNALEGKSFKNKWNPELWQAMHGYAGTYLLAIRAFAESLGQHEPSYHLPSLRHYLNYVVELFRSNAVIRLGLNARLDGAAIRTSAC